MLDADLVTLAEIMARRGLSQNPRCLSVWQVAVNGTRQHSRHCSLACSLVHPMALPTLLVSIGEDPLFPPLQEVSGVAMCAKSSVPCGMASHCLISLQIPGPEWGITAGRRCRERP